MVDLSPIRVTSQKRGHHTLSVPAGSNLRPDPGEAVQAPGRIAVAAPGQQVRIAMGAGRRFGPVGKRNAGRPELFEVGRSEVEEILPRAAGRGEKTGWKTGREIFAPDVLSDFIAGGADARPGRGDDVGRIRSEPLVHRPEGRPDDSGPGSLPPGMDGGDHAKAFVAKEKRQAIGCFYDQKKAGNAGYRGVSLRPFGRDFFNDMNNIRMDLIEKNRIKIAQTGQGPQALFIKLFCPESMDEAGDPGEAVVGKIKHIG